MNGHLVLVGLSGSGKSAVGRLVAAGTGRPLYDTDVMIAARAGLSVPDLLRTDAVAFRALEEDVVAGLAYLPAGVVATGGGVVLSPKNRKALRDGNLVLWLSAPVAILSSRLADGEDRPLLQGDVTSRLCELDRQRRALYAACAHRVLETDGLDAIEAAGLARDWLDTWECARVP